MTEAPLAGRWVLDTNILVSSLLKPTSVPAQVFARVLSGRGKLLVSQATLAELGEVLFRPKFDRYISTDTRQRFLVDLMPVFDLVPPSVAIRACRDPKDDKFLEVAVHGRADALITGDIDLLALHPFHGVPILSPADFLLGLASMWPASGEPGSTRSVQEASATYKARRKAVSP